MYAIVETGGKQYKVTPGQMIKVERLPVSEGSVVELNRVLFLADGKIFTAGTPVVEGARVLATSKGETRDDKIIVFKYKNKVRYRNKTSHRQIHTTLMIDKILRPGETAEAPKKTRRTRKAASEDTSAPVTPGETVKEETTSGS